PRSGTMTHPVRRIIFFAVGFAAAGLALATSGATLTAQTDEYQSPYQNQYRQSDQQILALLDRVARDAKQFDVAIDLALGKNPNRPVNPSAVETDADVLVNELMDASSHLRDHFTRRQVFEAD